MTLNKLEKIQERKTIILYYLNCYTFASSTSTCSDSQQRANYYVWTFLSMSHNTGYIQCHICFFFLFCTLRNREMTECDIRCRSDPLHDNWCLCFINGYAVVVVNAVSINIYDVIPFTSTIKQANDQLLLVCDVLYDICGDIIPLRGNASIFVSVRSVKIVNLRSFNWQYP